MVMQLKLGVLETSAVAETVLRHILQQECMDFCGECCVKP